MKTHIHSGISRFNTLAHSACSLFAGFEDGDQLLCRVVDINIAFWHSLKMIYSPQHGLHHQIGEGLTQRVFAYVCSRVGSGVLECNACLRMGSGFLSSMVHTLPMLGFSDAWCDRWADQDDSTGCSKMTILPVCQVGNRWNITNDKQWNTSGLFVKRPHHLQLLVQVLKASAIFAFLWLFAQDWEKG